MIQCNHKATRKKSQWLLGRNKEKKEIFTKSRGRNVTNRGEEKGGGAEVGNSGRNPNGQLGQPNGDLHRPRSVAGRHVCATPGGFPASASSWLVENTCDWGKCRPSLASTEGWEGWRENRTGWGRVGRLAGKGVETGSGA